MDSIYPYNICLSFYHHLDIFHLHSYQDLESEEAKVFKKVYLNMADTELAVSSSPEVFQKYDVKGNSVVLFKKV